MAAKQTPEYAERRRREIIARITSSEELLAQHRASRAWFASGKPGIPFAQIRAEAEARRRGA